MPPKRKAAESVEDSSTSAKSRRNAKTVASVPSGDTALKKPDADKDSGIETITYDEYLNAAIPDVLLQGLGFAESQTATAPESEPEEEAEDMPEPIAHVGGFYGSATALMATDYRKPVVSTVLVPPTCTVIPSQPIVRPRMTVVPSVPLVGAIGQVNTQSSVAAATGVMTARSKQVSAASPMRTSKRLHARTTTNLQSSTEEHNAAGHPTVSSAPPAAVEKRQPTPKATTTTTTVTTSVADKSRPRVSSVNTPSPSFSRNVGSRIVTKGNIMYERLPTGEVIASLVKKPPTSDVPLQPSSASGSPAATTTAALARPAPYRYMSPYSRATQPLISGLDQCPAGYPINDTNVVDVLEESIRATQSMRVMLMSLRDDLRRVGGAGGATMTPEQARRRRDIASKLMLVYGTYKRSIDDIENVRFPRKTVTAAATGAASNSSATACASDSLGSKSKEPSSNGSDSVASSESDRGGEDCTMSNRDVLPAVLDLKKSGQTVPDAATAPRNSNDNGTATKGASSASGRRRKAGAPARYNEVIDVL
jgi:hypothetical protein